MIWAGLISTGKRSPAAAFFAAMPTWNRRPLPFAEEAMLEASSGITMPFVEPTPSGAPAPSDAPAIALTTPSYWTRTGSPAAADAVVKPTASSLIEPAAGAG
jgi:hypothetical protein